MLFIFKANFISSLDVENILLLFFKPNVLVKLYFTAIDWNGNERIELSNICLNDLLDSPMPL